jgi:hypothetical protein
MMNNWNDGISEVWDNWIFGGGFLPHAPCPSPKANYSILTTNYSK